MTRAIAKPHSDWKDGFLFVGNQLTLDFLNTRPLQDGEALELLPDFDALLRWFQAAGLLSPRQRASLQKQWEDSARARRTVEVLRELRERLRNEVTTWEKGGSPHRAMVDELNQLMANHPMLFRLKATGGAASTEMWFTPRQPEDLYAPLAHSAAKLFAYADRNRVRQCGECVLHFQDTSKQGTRRWC